MNWNRRTSNLYSGMVQRFGPKWVCGKLVDPGRDLPFTLAELRTWMQVQIGSRVIVCRVCSIPMNYCTVGLDHTVPVSRGGGLGLDNLNLLYCQKCNIIKGSLKVEEMNRLQELIATFDYEAQKDILDRLANGGIGHHKMMRKVRAMHADSRKVKR